MLHRNLSLKIAAFAVAVGIWFWVLMTEHNPVVSHGLTVAVQVQDIDASLSLELAPTPVEVGIRCPKQDWLDVSKRIEAHVSAQRLRAGRHSLPVRVQAPDGVTVVSTSPGTQTIVLETLVIQSRPVEVKLDGRLPDGGALRRAAAAPSRVRVSGPRSRVEQVLRVVAALDLGRVVPDLPITVPVGAVDVGGGRVEGVSVSPEQVSVTVTGRRELASRLLPVLLQTTGQLPAGYRIGSVRVTPPFVAVTGPDQSVSDLQYLRTADLPLGKLTGNVTRRLSLLVPDGAKVLVDAEVTVTLHIVRELPVATPPVRTRAP